MSTRIEPPVLLSRLMTFVFAAAVVVLGVLGYTLYNMFPVTRPSVFFITSDLRPEMEVRINALPTTDNNFDLYMAAFVREYIVARNAMDATNIPYMHTKWNNGHGGIVYNWSTNAVYTTFTATNAWRSLMSNNTDNGFNATCRVEFQSGTPEFLDAKIHADGTLNYSYIVQFMHFCKKNNGQWEGKNYKIKIVAQIDTARTDRWNDRTVNPLGVRVTEYMVESGDGDPLNRPGIIL